MTKLREQMIGDMILRGFAPNTQSTYLRVISQLARHYGRSPDRISNRDVRAYLPRIGLLSSGALPRCYQAEYVETLLE